MTSINISQDILEQLVQAEIQKQLEIKVTDSLNQEALLRSITTIIRRSLDVTVIETYIKQVLDNQMKEPQSYLNTTITTKIDKYIGDWLVNNKWNMDQLIKTGIGSTIKSTETYNKYIEPLVTKYIAEDPTFIPYAKQEIHTKLNEKIKNFNKLVGDNISSQLVKDFLQSYLSNRFGDIPDGKDS